MCLPECLVCCFVMQVCVCTCVFGLANGLFVYVIDWLFVCAFACSCVSFVCLRVRVCCLICGVCVFDCSVVCDWLIDRVIDYLID